MAENSKIQWTDHTFNPWIGCTKVSPGCDNCYAERQGARLNVQWGAGEERRVAAHSTWDQVKAWDRRAGRDGVRKRVFCASLADVFDNAVPNHWRDDLWYLISECRNLDWLLLTKRIGNAPKMLPPDWGAGYGNVSIGISVVNQEEADRDIPKLLALPAARRFLSCEPLLGPIGLESLWGERRVYCGDTFSGYLDWRPIIDWVIVGGESGPHARPCDVEWIRSIVWQCKDASVPVFVKQLGARAYDERCGLAGAAIVVPDEYGRPTVRLRDPKGGNPDEWPSDLRIREFPR